ncbi:PTB domain-containing engulfment adapter protein 1-like isoform X2 [Silurus meridionalis]|uniref:PTB domain-containing engulfment adapter protein 1-like isoform X2 n=1 Tax=Silurus meridionalis TaxID=175797 RepID=UPI001EEC4F09|nr:PTB domain-containing engulfment adapter protein 1-like isoform X2 [Silurus meridionalis]
MEILMEAAAALQFMLYSCTLSSVSFCAVHQFQSKLFGFIANHPALDSSHCYVFQSTKFSHLLVSVIGDVFQSSRCLDSMRGSRDLVVEALRHKNKVLQKENVELKKKLQEKGRSDTAEEETDHSDTEQHTSHVRFNSSSDMTALLRNF